MKTELDPISVRRRNRFLLLTILGLLLSPGSAFAECPEETWAGPVRHFGMVDAADGIGGSGVVPGSGDEDGIGGSGVRPTGDGIGGSGVAPIDGGGDGIGGSGVYGTLTGFGSLCVNGQRIPYDETVAVTVDSVAENVQALAIGQVIRVTAVLDENGVRAREVDVQHEVVGPVTAVVDGGLEVMGLQVAERATASAGVDFAVGDRVAVSGLRREDGVIVASRIDRASEAQPDLIRGRTTAGAGGTERVGLVRIDASRLSGVSEVSGRAVVKGRWDERAGRLVANARAPGPRLPTDARVIDAEGYVVRAPDGGLSVVGIPLLERAGEDIRVGDRIRIRAAREGVGERPGPMRIRSLRPLSERPMLRRLERGARPPSGGPDMRPPRPRPGGPPGPARALVPPGGGPAGGPGGNPHAVTSIPNAPPINPSMNRPTQAPRVVRPPRPMPPNVRPRIGDGGVIRPPKDAFRPPPPPPTM